MQADDAATIAVVVVLVVFVVVVLVAMFAWGPVVVPPLAPPALSPTAPPSSFIVMAIFKNEAHVMREWVQHYAAQGAKHLVLIDNDSTDGSADTISDYVQSGFVTIVHEPRRHYQDGAYNENLYRHVKGKAEWLVVCDLDEFVFGTRGAPLARELELVPPDVGVILMRWIMFGSNGHIAQPPSVVKHFTRRVKYPDATPNFANNKYIVRVRSAVSLTPHEPVLAQDDPTVPTRALEFGTAGRTEASLKREPVRVHHYAIQSKDWFRKVKMTRGSAHNATHDSVRTNAYFALYDRNDVKDTSLVK